MGLPGEQYGGSRVKEQGRGLCREGNPENAEAPKHKALIEWGTEAQEDVPSLKNRGLRQEERAP